MQGEIFLILILKLTKTTPVSGLHTHYYFSLEGFSPDWLFYPSDLKSNAASSKRPSLTLLAIKILLRRNISFHGNTHDIMLITQSKCHTAYIGYNYNCTYVFMCVCVHLEERVEGKYTQTETVVMGSTFEDDFFPILIFLYIKMSCLRCVTLPSSEAFQ